MDICQQNGQSGEVFEQVNDILEDQDSPTQAQILTLKINEMRKIISSLTKNNEKLITRIQQLEEAMQQKNTAEQTTSFNEEYSVMQCDFNDIEELIKQYRKQLVTYQQSVKGQLKQRASSLELLSQENQQLKNANQRLRTRVQELQMQNEMLLQTKDNLLNQIEQLESSARKSNVQSPRYHKRYNDPVDYVSKYQDSSSDFNTNVQRQLQKLIQKLVKELEHERYLKKKLTEQVRKLQKDVLEQQKELINKNNKIYAMQMSSLKRFKTESVSQAVRLKNQREEKKGTKTTAQRVRSNRQRENGTQSTPSPKSKTFTLMQLMNQCLVLTSKEKLIIASKIIQFFLKKFQKYDYSSQVLESIVISNFSSANPHMCVIRVNKEIQNGNNHSRGNSEAEGIWNLAFVLDNLFNQTDTKDRDFGMNRAEESVIETVMFMLQNKDENILRSVLQLKRNVQSAINQRSQ